MKNAINLLWTLAAILLMISCEKEEYQDPRIIVGQGKIMTRQLDLDPFTDIDQNGVGNLYVTAGVDQSVTLKAQQNLIDIMTWEVMGGTLIIGIKDNIYLQKHEEIRFEITVPDLSYLRHDGIGDITLSGNKRDVLDIEFLGVGNIRAFELPLDHCVIRSSGIGDCEFMVQAQLDANISGVGNVYYRGNPEIALNDTGVGELINDN